MKKLVFSLVALLLSLPVFSQIHQKYAIVIGIKDYVYVPPLRNSLNDAMDMAATLKANGFQTIEVYNPKTKRELQDALVKYFNLVNGKSDAAGLVFYSGHGMQVDGVNYLLPTTANPILKADLDDQAVKMDYLLGVLDQAGNALNIFIMDACRNSPFRSFSRAVDPGLGQVNAPKGSYVVYATAPGSVASDGTDRNGLFTSKLLKHINTPGVAIEQVFKMVARDVQAESHGTQVPWMNISYFGDFYFSNGPVQNQALVVTQNTSLPPVERTATKTMSAFDYYVKGGEQFQRLQYDSAIASCSVAIAMEPNKSIYHWDRARAYHEVKKYQGEINDYKKIIELDPSSDKVYLVPIARAYESAEQLDSARITFDELIRRYPMDAQSYSVRAYFMGNKGDHNASIADFTKAIELTGQKGNYLYYRGRAEEYRSSGRLDQALADYSKSLQIEKRNPNGYARRGSLFLLMNKPQDAIADFDKLLETAPDNVFTLVERGRARIYLKKLTEGQADFTRVIQLCNENIAKDPKIVLNYYNRGSAEMHLAKYEDAIKDMTLYIEANPTSGFAYLNRGWCKQLKGDLQGALADLTKANDVSPNEFEISAKLEEIKKLVEGK